MRSWTRSARHLTTTRRRPARPASPAWCSAVGGALLGGLADRLAEVVRLPVEVGDPFQRYPASGTVYGPEELAQVGPPLVTSIGLALGGLE